MDLGKVEKQSLFYAILKFYGRILHDYFFYKEVTYIGIENIPKNKPVLIAPNHQNALMDPAAIIFSQNIQPVFLARSDIFKNKLVAKFLFKLKILPVFRLRDGKKKLKLNEQIYNKTIEVLEKNRQVVIFPEASHFDKKHVQKIKKGIQRIAFMLEERNNFEANVSIIPTGIYYSNYWNFNSKLVVNYGKPITLKKYKDEYKTDPARAIVRFTNEFYKKIKAQTIHIENLDFYNEYDLLRDINEEQMLANLSLKKTPQNKLKTDQETIKKLDLIEKEDIKKFNEIILKIKKYSIILKTKRLKDWVVKEKSLNNKFILRFTLLLVSSPIFIYGFINNFITYFLPNLITSKLKDKQFTSSIVYVFMLLIFPIIHFIQASVVYFMYNDWLFSLLYLISIPFSGFIAFKIHRYFIKTMSLLRFYKTNNKEEVINLRNEIIELIK